MSLFAQLRTWFEGSSSRDSHSSSHFPVSSNPLFGRTKELEVLVRNAQRSSEITVVYGRPLMGKSALLLETARQLEGKGYLVGQYETRGDTSDILLRAVSNLYASWLHKASYSKQLDVLIQQQRSDFLVEIVEVVCALVKAGKKLMPFEELGVLATSTLHKLVEQKGKLDTGGIELPKLSYEQARDLVQILTKVTGKPVVLILDGLDTIQHSDNLIESQRTFLNAFLKYSRDWPRVHIFLGMRTENLQQKIGALLSALEPSTSVHLRELSIMDLQDPAERSRLLLYLRAHVPATVQTPDDALLDMLGGYPGVLFQWLKATPQTIEELRQLAEDASHYRYRELMKLAEAIVQEDTKTGVVLSQLLLLPECKSHQDWKPFESVIVDWSEMTFFELKKRGILNPKSGFPSFEHSTRHDALKTWLLSNSLGIAISQGSSKQLIERLAAQISDADPAAYPFGVALSAFSQIAAKLDLPESHRLLALATHPLLSSLRSHSLCLELADRCPAFVAAATEHPKSAPLITMALTCILDSAGSEQQEAKENAAWDALAALNMAFPNEKGVRKWYVRCIVVRATLRISQKNPTAARELFDEAIALDPQSALARNSRGGYYYDNKEYQLALADYDTLCQIEPRNSLAFADRGMAKAASGDLVGALADYNHALELNPKDITALRNRGVYYFDRKQELDLALADYNQLIQIDPKNSLAYYYRGLVRELRQESEEALSDYDQAITLDVNNSLSLLSRGGLLLTKGNLDRALADYNAVLQIDSQNLLGYINRGAVLEGKGEFEKALDDYNHAILLDPKNTQALLKRGIFFQTRQMAWDLALADYETVLQLDSNNSVAITNRGIIRQTKKDFDGALADFNTALLLEPASAAAFNRRSLLYREYGNLTAALADTEKALQLDPMLEEAHWSRAYLLYDLQRWLEALDTFRDLVKRATSQYGWLPLLIWAIRSRLGERSSASEELRMALLQAQNRTDVMPLKIGQFLLGELTEEELLATPPATAGEKTAADFCGIYYFIGLTRLLANDLKGARTYMQKCRDTQWSDYYEWTSAGVELQNLSAANATG